jgi:hypothetical protein
MPTTCSELHLGFDELSEKVKAYPPEHAAQWTGIAADDIRKLAREYATVRPSVIRVNYGVQRSDGGGMATRAIAMLPCFIGSWKEVGGGLHLSTSGSYGLNKDALRRPVNAQAPGSQTRPIVNMVELGKHAEHAERPPLKPIIRLQLQSGGGLSEPQRSRARPEAHGPFHRGPRAVLHRHHRLRRHRLARNDILRAQGPADRVWPLLPAGFEPGD